MTHLRKGFRVLRLSFKRLMHKPHATCDRTVFLLQKAALSLGDSDIQISVPAQFSVFGSATKEKDFDPRNEADRDDIPVERRKLT